MNITELKEKLTKEFSGVNIPEYSYLTGRKHQHSQDAKTITALLEIIEDMQKVIEQCKIQRDDAIWNRFKTNPKYEKVFFADELAKIMDAELDETLTATEQKLKELT